MSDLCEMLSGACYWWGRWWKQRADYLMPPAPSEPTDRCDYCGFVMTGGNCVLRDEACPKCGDRCAPF